MKIRLLSIILCFMAVNTFAIPVKVKEVTLSNGLTVWLNEDHSQPKIVGSVVVRIGAKDSPNTGIAHYFEHILFKGTDRIGTINYAAEKEFLDKIEERYTALKQATTPEARLEIQRQINELSIKAAQYAVPNDFSNLISKYGGSRLNAATSYDYTYYYNQFTAPYLEHWCELNSERMINPVFRLFQSELETVYEEKNMYDDRLGTGQMHAIFERFAAPHPYQYPIIGSADALKNPDLVAMKEFWEKYYVAGNMALILVGDFDSEVALPIIERTFGRIRPGAPERPQHPLPKPFRGVERFDVKFPVPFVTGRLVLWNGVPAAHEDEAPLSLLSMLFNNDSHTGILDKFTIDRKVMAASVGMYNFKDLGALFAMAVPRIPFGSAKKAQKRVLAAIEEIKAGNISDERFESLKNNYLRQSLVELEDFGNRISALQQFYANGKGWADYQAMLDRVNRLTKDDLIAVARKYFTENYLEVRKKTGRYPKEKMVKPPFSPIIAPNRGAESPFAKYLSTLPINNKDIHPLDLEHDAQRTILGGNSLVTLYTIPNDINSIFSLDIVFQKGQYNAPLLGYIYEYMDRVGTRTKSAHELKEAFERLGTTIRWSVGRLNGVRVTIMGYDDKFDESVALLADFLYNTQIDEKQMKSIVEIKNVSDKATKKSVDEKAQLLYRYVRYGDAAAHMRALTKAQLKQAKASDMVALLQDLLRTEYDVHYVGRLSTKEVVTSLERHLRIAEVTQKGEPSISIPTKTHDRCKIFLLNDSKVSQAVIYGYMHLSGLTEHDKECLVLYNSYLSGGMSSLLFQEIREYRSMAYGVRSYYDLADPIHKQDDGDIIYFLSTQTDKTIDALALLDSLVHQAPTQVERYNDGKQMLINSAYASMPEMRAKSRHIASMLRAGYARDYSVTNIEIAKRITHANLLDFVAKYVSTTPVTYTIVGNIKNLNMDELKKIGEVIILKDKECLNI